MGKFDSLPSATVLYRRDITSSLMIIRIKPEVEINFQPGQYATLHLDGISRPYSIVSAPAENFLEFFIELVENGELTPRLWRLRVGDTLKVFPKAKGKFIFEPDDRFKNHCFVATVTGIAPFVSMARQAAIDHGWRDKNVMIFHGASYQDELAYSEELTDILVCRYFPTISRPLELRNAGWNGLRGRVNNVFLDFLKENRTSFRPNDTLIYACGHPGMVKDVEFRANEMGFNVKTEKYFTIS